MAKRLVQLVAQGDEVPARPKSPAELDVPEQADVCGPDLSLHVVGQHERPAAPAGPGGDRRHRAACERAQLLEEAVVEVMQAGLGRPAGKLAALLDSAVGPAHGDLCLPRQQRPRAVVQATEPGARLLAAQIPLAPVGRDRLVRVEGKRDLARVAPPDRGRRVAVERVQRLGRRPGACCAREPRAHLLVLGDAGMQADRAQTPAPELVRRLRERRIEQGLAGGVGAERAEGLGRTARLDRVRSSEVVQQQERRLGGEHVRPLTEPSPRAAGPATPAERDPR